MLKSFHRLRLAARSQVSAPGVRPRHSTRSHSGNRTVEPCMAKVQTRICIGGEARITPLD